MSACDFFFHVVKKGCGCGWDGPYLLIVTRLLDDLGRHPEGRSDKRVLLGHGCGELARDTEVGELDVACCGEEDVGGLDVTMELALVVEVLESLEELAEDDRDKHLLKRTWLHLQGVF